jgi:hypothetical protein
MGSCLRVYFNEMLLSLISSGLIDKWASGFIDVKYLKKPVNDDIKILSLDQLEGAFQLLVAGLLAGFVAFCGENLIGRDLMIKIRKIVGFDKFLSYNPKKLRSLKKEGRKEA